MGARTWTRVAIPALIVAVAAGYGAADAADVVPGWVTLAPISRSPAPFPVAVEASAPQAPAEPAALLAYEHSLVHADDLSRVDVAFFTLNGWISVGYFGVTLASRWLPL